MRFSKTVVTCAAAAGITSASPIEKRAINDATILNYALTLEHLEDAFYRQGLAKFSELEFTVAGFGYQYNKIKTIASDEATHVNFLTTALKGVKATPVAECKYNFGITDVRSFLTTASILEGVGVSAYLGAAAQIMSKDYLTAAGSILTVEARHSSYIRNALQKAPFAQPFDAPLSINEVYSLASQFIVECPKTNPTLPVKAFPKLTLDPKAPKPVKAGATVTLQTSVKGTNVYAAFIAVTGPVFVKATPVTGGFKVTVPQGFHGQSYAVLTSSKTAVSDDNVLAGPVILELA